VAGALESEGVTAWILARSKSNNEAANSKMDPIFYADTFIALVGAVTFQFAV
jgi:hypothetical protein